MQIIVLLIIVAAMLVKDMSIVFPTDEITIPDGPAPLGEGIPITTTNADIYVIPDRYNTGYKGQVEPISVSDGKAEVNGVLFGTSTGHYGPVLTFDYLKNKDLQGTIIFENIDFSGYVFTPYRNDQFTEDVRLIFNNCKFGMFLGYKSSENQKSFFEFNNCHIDSFTGCNATFDRCDFGQSYKDGIRPFQNITVTNCFFGKFESMDAAGSGYHTDGMQTYGDELAEATNIVFDNCRFECPSLGTGCSAKINACIMIQMEYNNADGIYVRNSILNGGGYTIYARSKYQGLELRNVELSNIKVGAACLYGIVYSDVADSVVINNLSGTSELYVGTVWKDGNGTHVSVTNDTSMERKLLIVTNNGEYEYTVNACPFGSQLGTITAYDDFPFDIDIALPEDSDYVVCYDVTSSVRTQIRFVNYTDNPVYETSWTGSENVDEEYIDTDIIYAENIDAEIVDTEYSGAENWIESGQCGKDVYYYITDTGKLVIYGSGPCYDYHSGKLPPWEGEMKSFIRSVEVLEGVTTIGNQMFRSCIVLERVSLPSTLNSIGTRAFNKCNMLYYVTIPSSVTSIGSYAFDKTLVSTVDYLGTQEEWDAIFIDEGNRLTANFIDG